MRNLKEALIYARGHRYAIPAFNIFDYHSARAVIRAGEGIHMPVILQTSMGTVQHYGAKELKNLLEGLQKEAGTEVYLHLDHCTDQNLAINCVDCGWDSIMIDGSALPFEENVCLTRKIADYAHDKGCCVEGELGTIEGVEEEITVEVGQQVGVEECLEFLERSGIDYFAPAIGTAHGVYRGAPKINFGLLNDLGKMTEIPVVIHGGTGLEDEIFKKLVNAGAAKINISTALKCAYFQAVKEYLEKTPNQVSPLALETRCSAKIHEVAQHMLETFRI